MVLLATSSHLLSGVCVWSLLSVYLYHFPPLKSHLPLSHSSRLYLGGACCSFLHCTTTLLVTTWFLTEPSLSLGRPIALFSCSYFLYDTGHQLFHDPQAIYLVHHITCITVWLLILSYQQGYRLACEFLWVAELSNLTRIPWELSSRLQWTQLRRRLETPNRLSYLASRCLLLPLHLWYRTPSLLALPLPTVVSHLLWLVAIVFIGVGIYYRPLPVSAHPH